MDIYNINKHKHTHIRHTFSAYLWVSNKKQLRMLAESAQTKMWMIMVELIDDAICKKWHAMDDNYEEEKRKRGSLCAYCSITVVITLSHFYNIFQLKKWIILYKCNGWINLTQKLIKYPFIFYFSKHWGKAIGHDHHYSNHEIALEIIITTTAIIVRTITAAIATVTFTAIVVVVIDIVWNYHCYCCFHCFMNEYDGINYS